MAEETSTAPAESTAPEDEPTPETEEGAPEGEETEPRAEGEGEAEPAKPEEKPQVFDIDGEEVSLEDLKDGYKQIRHAVEVAKEAKALRAQTKEILHDIAHKTDDALIEIFTAKNNGDRSKGYAETVQWAAKVIENHTQLNGLSEPEREALRHKTQAEEYKRRLEAVEQEKKEAKRKENKVFWEKQLVGAATKAGLPTDPDTMEDLARALINMQAAGSKVDVAKAADALKKEYKKRRARLWSSADLEEVPPDVLERLRKRDLETVKKNRNAPQVKTPRKAEPGETFWAPTRAQSY